MGDIHPSPRTIRFRGPTALGAVAVAVLGGATAYVGFGPRDTGPAVQRIPFSAVATTTTEPPPAPDTPQSVRSFGTGAGELSSEEQQLVGLLPAGYGPDSCQSITPRVKGALATVDCFDNASPGGPSAARYSLFPDAKTMEQGFQSTVKAVTISECPDGPSPGKWHYGSDSSKGGSIACGTDSGNGNAAAVVWTDNTIMVGGCAEGPDLDALYKWWQQPAPAAAPQRVNRP